MISNVIAFIITSGYNVRTLFTCYLSPIVGIASVLNSQIGTATFMMEMTPWSNNATTISIVIQLLVAIVFIGLSVLRIKKNRKLSLF